ncbi:hypothetical protein AB832_03445 [Flavobacteriaceae bacterium (ex Bugula neritina AB1)]|nr:hypothetical protein AB832_03445 [Flavobacteriaceae bacterium (ex Bugula neritina AB1)]
MKSKQPTIKYIEWRSPEELYEASHNWVSELKFIKDEQHFLDELLENYTLQLISDNIFEKSSAIIKELSALRKNIEPMFKKVIKHQNELNILLDGVDQPEEERKYKQDHGKLMIEVCRYFNSYKDLKKEIFTLIKTIMKQSKQRRLLS